MNNKEKNQNEFHFDGNVKVVGSDLDATADQLIVFADKSAGGNSNQVGTMHEMIATGHVNIVQPNRRAISGKAIIYPQTGKMILLETPVVFSKDGKGGESKVTGDRMELYRDDNRAVVIGGPKERPKITLMGEMPSLTSSPTKKVPSETPAKAERAPGKDAPKPPSVAGAVATPVAPAKEIKAQQQNSHNDAK
jgi:lipopolysaccharide export system protein LptA